MKLVPNAFRQQLFVHPGGPVREAVFILLPAINVDNLRPHLDLISSRETEGIILLPMWDINWIAKDPAQQPSQRPGIV